MTQQYQFEIIKYLKNRLQNLALTLYAPTSHNGQTHASNWLAIANELIVFEHFVGLALIGLILI